MPPGRGLRGVLDNIVSDGIRVAAEVRKRVDDAQRELAVHHDHDDDDDEDDEDEDPARADVDAVTSPAMIGGVSSWGAGAFAAERRVREADRDLLEGAEVVDEQKSSPVALVSGHGTPGQEREHGRVGEGEGEGDESPGKERTHNRVSRVEFDS